MDEQAIVEKLAQNTEQPQPEPVAPTPAPVKEGEEFIHDNLPLENTLEKMKLLDHFNIPSEMRREAAISTWLDRVVDWARDEAGSSEFTDILRVIDDQERVLGTRVKQDRLMKLYQFVTIRSQRNKLAQMERTLYGG